MYNRKKTASPLSKHLAAVRSFALAGTKAADFGGKGDSASFEQAFSNLAHAYLRDSAPKLLDHEIGFQLLDRDQENTKAVGVFAFKVGSNWLYAPVFFLNGDLKGHELLYIKNQDMFVPLKENWINYLINRKPSILGASVDRNLSRLGQRQPDFTQLSRSPAKFGSANPTLKEMMAAAMGTFAKCATLNTADTFAEMGRRLDLAKFLKEARFETLNMLVNTFKHAPQLAKAFDEFHGLEIVKEAIALARTRETTVKVASILADAPKKPESAKGLKIIGPDVTVQTKLPPGTTEEDQEKLLRDGVLIKDERGDDAVSVPYNIQVEQRLFNPTRSGIYDVLTKTGTVERCYIALYPMGAARRANFVTVVRLEGEKNWVNTRADLVFCLTEEPQEELDKWFESLSAANSVAKGDSVYMLVGPTGDGTVPFGVERELGSGTFGENSYSVHFYDSCEFARDRRALRMDKDPLNYDEWRDGSRIHLNGKQGTQLRASMGDIFVPEGFKLLTVRAPKKDKDDDSVCAVPCCDSSSENPPVLLGNLVDAQLSIMQKTAALTVRQAGASFVVNDKLCDTPVSALVHLVKDHGLREAAARDMLKTAAEKRKYEGRIKYADQYGGPMMVNDAPVAPADPGPVMGGESIMGASVPTQMGLDVGLPVSSVAPDSGNRALYNPNTLLDQQDVRKVMDAAQTGQKDVFDTAMIGTMLRAVRDDSLVDRYMGDLTSGLDKLGRILFMFYWHGDRFADRYGKSDMPELEDSLRNAFEMVGDVVLFLKQKTVDPHPEESATDVDLGNVANA